ncbi:MAG: hypothetical protein EOO14_00280 [Chitinophagaceae bacterium]|nr:MAG: hypothetical protein EOO14_00280 [Chitinophagaceae bacterium]
MSSAENEKTTERAKIFETVLSSPGMAETCKIILNPSRQAILLLSRMIEQGLETKDGKKGDELLSFLPVEAVNELREVMEEMLKRGGLGQFYERLKTL